MEPPLRYPDRSLASHTTRWAHESRTDHKQTELTRVWLIRCTATQIGDRIFNSELREAVAEPVSGAAGEHHFECATGSEVRSRSVHVLPTSTCCSSRAEHLSSGNEFVAATKLGGNDFGRDSLDAAMPARDSDERIMLSHRLRRQ